MAITAGLVITGATARVAGPHPRSTIRSTQRDVAQPGRAPGLEPEGRPFKSDHPDPTQQSRSERSAAGARLIGVQEVASSILAVPTTKKNETRSE